MTPAGGFWAGGLANAGFPKGSFDVQLFPKWKSQRHQFGTGGQWMAAAGEHKEEAWDYMKYRISKEAMDAWYGANGIITTPSRRSMLVPEALRQDRDRSTGRSSMTRWTSTRTPRRFRRRRSRTR